jgi:hypothetical protein
MPNIPKLNVMAENLRARAEEVLARAETMRTPDVRTTLQRIAVGYERLAELLEKEAGEDK